MRDIIKYKVLGVMSGTSLDGIDLAICKFAKNHRWSFSIEKNITLKYSDFWKKELKSLHLKSPEKIKKINTEYGIFIAKEINKFIKNDSIDLIASHGHTIFHQPENNFTLQIGCGKTIAKLTNIKTINNFRSLDVSLGGQGAPLVPIGDLLLFNKYKYCLNLGGFANLSIKEKNQIRAFDICPVNIVANNLAQREGMLYDDNGNIGERGEIIPKILTKLNKLNFYNTPSPKSLSREWVTRFIKPILSDKYQTEDLLHTLYEHIAIQIGKELKNKSCLVTGGGAFNKFLISKIKNYSKAKIIIPEDKIVNFKEALIFGFLGVLKERGEINCLKKVTGAKKDNSGGVIHIPN